MSVYRSWRKAGLEAVLCQPTLLRSTGKDGSSPPFWRSLGNRQATCCPNAATKTFAATTPPQLMMLSRCCHQYRKFFCAHIITSKIVIARWHFYHLAIVMIYICQIYIYATLPTQPYPCTAISMKWLSKRSIFTTNTSLS